MELAEAIARRRMVRRFDPRPVSTALVERLIRAGLRAPSAGNAAGVDLLVLTSDEMRSRFWALASDPSWRSSPAAHGLLAAPLVVLVLGDPAAYLDRYGQSDKAGTRLAGRTAENWPVPYWTVDAAFSVMNLLLTATDLGLGALFFQLHGEETTILAGLGTPPGRTAIGALAIGHPAEDAMSRSSRRPRRATERVHREGW